MSSVASTLFPSLPSGNQLNPFPEMPVAYASTVLNSPAADVWKRIRDFGDLSWLPSTMGTEMLDGKSGDQLRSAQIPGCLIP